MCAGSCNNSTESESRKVPARWCLTPMRIAVAPWRSHRTGAAAHQAAGFWVWTLQRKRSTGKWWLCSSVFRPSLSFTFIGDVCGSFQVLTCLTVLAQTPCAHSHEDGEDVGLGLQGDPMEPVVIAGSSSDTYTPGHVGDALHVVERTPARLLAPGLAMRCRASDEMQWPAPPLQP